MAVKIIKILSCSGCPHKQEIGHLCLKGPNVYEVDHYFCGLTVESFELTNIRVLPDWCPLEDYNSK